MTSYPKTYRGIIYRYSKYDNEIKRYFAHLPKLLSNFPLTISLSYMFFRVEMAMNMAIYCGILKIHRGNGELTSKTINRQHITREQYRLFFKNIFEVELKTSIYMPLERAQKIRDKLMHGKRVNSQDIREAMIDILEFAASFNDIVNQRAKFRPFGRLQGFKGRTVALDKTKTRWILKGMGFNIS